MADNDTLNRRTETAKRNDDSDLVDETMIPSQQGRNQGVLEKDVGTQAENERVSDPDATEGVTKGDMIDHGMFDYSDKRGDR